MRRLKKNQMKILKRILRRSLSRELREIDRGFWEDFKK